jgi:hypothetical protein
MMDEEKLDKIINELQQTVIHTSIDFQIFMNKYIKVKTTIFKETVRLITIKVLTEKLYEQILTEQKDKELYTMIEQKIRESFENVIIMKDAKVK